MDETYIHWMESSVALYSAVLWRHPKGQIHTDMDQVLQYHREPWGQCWAVYRPDQGQTSTAVQWDEDLIGSEC